MELPRRETKVPTKRREGRNKDKSRSRRRFAGTKHDVHQRSGRCQPQEPRGQVALLWEQRHGRRSKHGDGPLSAPGSLHEKLSSFRRSADSPLVGVAGGQERAEVLLPFRALQGRCEVAIRVASACILANERLLCPFARAVSAYRSAFRVGALGRRAVAIWPGRAGSRGRCFGEQQPRTAHGPLQVAG